jgi:hypothetical protein
MGKSAEEAPDSYVKLNHARVLGLANRVATAISTDSSSAIGSDRCWNDQAVEEQNGDSEDEQHTFHWCFLLVTANWTVIFSWPLTRLQRGFETLERSEFVTR